MEKAVAFAKAIYHAYWGEGRDMSPVEAVSAVAYDRIDPSAAKAATQDVATDRLKRETEPRLTEGHSGLLHICR